MSRLAKKSIPVPAGVTLEMKDGGLFVKGPKGERRVSLPSAVEVKMENGSVMVRGGEGADQLPKTIVGTAWSLVKNAIQGVVEGFSKILEIEGVGYRAVMEGDTLVLSLGYVNPVRVKVPPGIAVTVEKNVIKITGIDKELVGRVASSVRSLKKPEPYKGKGIRYQGEVVKRKVGKKAATAAAS